VTVDAESLAAPAPAGDDLAERYLWYLDVGRASLVQALTLLAATTTTRWSSTVLRARTVPGYWPPSCWSWWGWTAR